ncbi:MAG: AlbA family DNA-binding domain-containing protein [Solirubrobacteraceae bacterium]
MTTTLTDGPRLHCERMSGRSFWRRFGRFEHERLEFKSSVNHLCESVVAMAMTDGGTILIGVSDDRRLTGHPIEQRALDRIAGVANETQVDLGVRSLSVSGAPVLAVTVPAVRPRVVTTPDGRMLRRVGSANQPLRGEAVTRFLRARERDATPAAAEREPIGCRLARLVRDVRRASIGSGAAGERERHE